MKKIMTEKQYINVFNSMNESIVSFVCVSLENNGINSNYFSKFFGQLDNIFWDGLRYGVTNFNISWEESHQARLMLLTMFYVLGDKNIYGED